MICKYSKKCDFQILCDSYLYYRFKDLYFDLYFEDLCIKDLYNGFENKYTEVYNEFYK